VLANENYLIKANMHDMNNQRVLDSEKYVYFSMGWNAELSQNHSTSTRRRVIGMAIGYAAIELVPNEQGWAIIEAGNQDSKGSYMIINFEQ